MGYYSDIRLALDKKSWGKLRRLAEKDSDVAELLKTADGLEEKEAFTSMAWWGIKWMGYEDDDTHFPEIGKMQRFIDKLPRESYYFKVEGEDDAVVQKGLLFENPKAKLENPIREELKSLIGSYGIEKTVQALNSLFAPDAKDDGNKITAGEAAIVNALNERQIHEAYEIQRFRFLVEDADNHCQLLYPDINFTKDDLEAMACRFRENYDCNVAENTAWDQIVEDYAAQNYPRARMGQ